MWTDSIEVLNPYEATKASRDKQIEEMKTLEDLIELFKPYVSKRQIKWIVIKVKFSNWFRNILR